MAHNDHQMKALKEMLYKMADDQLILGHRNSEWTGLGPILEEDIAFSSIAQDKIGQSQVLYSILNNLGEAPPDTIAFTRNSNQFKCCRLVEYPIGEYDFSLMRNFLFNHADSIRFEMLSNSSADALSNASRKFRGEIKYHIMHADTWLNQLGKANEESHNRMQKALDITFNKALSIFEPGDNDELLAEQKIFAGEKKLEKRWLETVIPIIEKATLKVPDKQSWSPEYGGRKGKHTEHLQPLIDEMSVVFRLDPKAEW